jgi:hypothetical protein
MTIAMITSINSNGCIISAEDVEMNKIIECTFHPFSVDLQNYEMKLFSKDNDLIAISGTTSGIISGFLHPADIIGDGNGMLLGISIISDKSRMYYVGVQDFGKIINLNKKPTHSTPSATKSSEITEILKELEKLNEKSP